MREYITLPEAEIAPTSASRTPVDRPVAVVEAVNTASPVLWHVHVDHLHRPIRMTDAAKASVWDAQWLPWGGVHSITGIAVMDARFPGQWFQSETGLHYNWHRSYDPTIGRYTQPDPLGFVDGPSVYGYARGGPQSAVDPTGEAAQIIIGGAALTAAQLLKMCLRALPKVKPKITRPPPPKSGCTCSCAAGDANEGGLLGYVVVESTANTCPAAAKDACSAAVNRLQVKHVHHVQAKCSDGGNYSGSGSKAQ